MDLKHITSSKSIVLQRSGPLSEHRTWSKDFKHFKSSKSIVYQSASVDGLCSFREAAHCLLSLSKKNNFFKNLTLCFKRLFKIAA